VPKGSVLCLLCRGAINLKSGDLGRFKSHLESVHDAQYDMELIISLTFLEGGEKDGFVENIYPRIKDFFKSIKHNVGTYSVEKLGIEKRLLEDEEEEHQELNPRKKMRREEEKPKVAEKIDADKFSEDDLDESIVDIAENDYISDEESDVSDNDEDQVEVSPAKAILSHCDLCQLSLPPSSFQAHMELHEKEVDDSSTSNDSIEGLKENKQDSLITEKEQDGDDLVDDKIYSKCEICNKTLKRKNMSRHKKRLHGISGSQNILEKVEKVSVDTIENEEKSSAIDSNNEHLTEDLLQQSEDKNDQALSTGPCALTRCDICMKPMQRKSLARHMAKLHPTDKIRIGSPSPSPIASRFNDQSVDRELSMLEEQEYDYKCKICFTRFQALDDLRIHVKEDHDIDYEDLEGLDNKDIGVSREGTMKKMETQLSQETDQDVTTLDEKNDEEPDRKFQCSSCDFKFNRKESLARHNRKAHRDV